MAGCGPSNFRECIHSGSKSPESLIDYTFAFSSYSDFDAVLDFEHSGEQVRAQSCPHKTLD